MGMEMVGWEFIADDILGRKKNRGEEREKKNKERKKIIIIMTCLT
jgi:hypothetical protein